MAASRPARELFGELSQGILVAACPRPDPCVFRFSVFARLVIFDSGAGVHCRACLGDLDATRAQLAQALDRQAHRDRLGPPC